MISEALLIAATVIGGDVGPFVYVEGGIGPADEAHTPGSGMMYDEVNTMPVYDKGIVKCNGTVVTNVPFPSVVSSAQIGGDDDDCDYGWCYSVSAQAGERPSKNPWAIAMNQFDLTWVGLSNNVARSKYYAYGTSVVTKTISPSVYLPKTLRMNSDTKAALLASAEAYYERLYWASKGESDDWDTSVWGRTTPGPGFKFNYAVGSIISTNRFEYAYPTNSWRLLEYPNFKNELAAIKNMFPTYNRLKEGYQIHPAWIYRPTWSTKSNFKWWASSKTPPLVPQFYNQATPETSGMYMPTEDDFKLLPTFDWTRAVDPSDVRDAKWATKGVTLDVFDGGTDWGKRGSSWLSPCSVAVGMAIAIASKGSIPYTSSRVDSYDAGVSLPEFMMHVFNYAGRESVNTNRAKSKYLACYENDSVRLTPKSFTGINHILCAMDSTIEVPQQSAFHKRLSVTVDRDSYYHDNPRVVSGAWFNGKYVMTIQDGASSIPRERDEVSVTTNEYRNSTLETAWLDIRPGVQHDSTSGSFGTDFTAGFKLYISRETAKWLINQSLCSAIVITELINLGTLSVHYKEVSGGCVIGEEKSLDIPILGDNFGETTTPVDAANFSARCTRNYEYERTQVPTMYNCYVSPPHSSDSHVNSKHYATAWARRYTLGNGNPVQQLRCVGEQEYGIDSFSHTMLRHYNEAVDDLGNFSVSAYGGKDYRNPFSFAKTPTQVSVDYDGAKLTYSPMSYTVSSLVTYPEVVPFYTTRLHGYFDLDINIWGSYDLTRKEVDIYQESDVVAFVKRKVAPDGWVWTDTAWTNVVSTEVITGPTNITHSYSRNLERVEYEEQESWKWPWEPGYEILRHEYTNNYVQVDDYLHINTHCFGPETVVTEYYGPDMTITNVTTNVTSISYAYETSTYDPGEEELVRIDVREWKEYSDNPARVVEEQYMRDMDKLLYIRDGGNTASWVIVLPERSNEVYPLYESDIPILIGTAAVQTRLADQSGSVSVRADFPEMPRDEFVGREAFCPLTQINWKWKSMKDDSGQ